MIEVVNCKTEEKNIQNEHFIVPKTEALYTCMHTGIRRPSDTGGNLESSQ